MTRRRTDRFAERLGHRLHRAADVIPEIREHLNEQRGHVRTIGAPSSDEGRSGGGHSDPTLRAVMDLNRCDQLEGYIDDALRSIEVGINLLDEACRNALGYRRDSDVGEAKPRCIGDNTAAGATCWNVPTPRRNAAGMTVDDGRCVECGPRYDAARRAASDARRMRRHMDKLGGQ